MRKTPKKIKTAITQRERITRKCEEAFGGDMSKMTRTEQNSFAKYTHVLEKHFAALPERLDYGQLIQANDREFWRNEYLKRKFFLEAKEAGCADFTTHELFTAIAEWRSRRDQKKETVGTNPDCKRARCRFNLKSKAGKQSLKYPFFYSKHACRCEFTDSVQFSIVCWHNHIFPHIQTAFQLGSNLGFHNTITTWSPEFTQVVETIHFYSYRYGQFGQSLFSLMSPMDLIKAEGKIRFPGHTESFLLEGDEECDPQLMQIMMTDPETNTVLKERAENLNNYELHVGVDLLTPEPSLKKETAKIKKAMGLYAQGKLSNPKVFTPESDAIIFSYNPSSKSFSPDKALNISKLAMASYLSVIGRWDALDEDYQEQAYEKLNYITATKSYQARNIKRAIGLCIWDQVHYLDISRNDAIRSMTNSKLFEVAMELDEDAIELREIIPGDEVKDGQEAIGSQAEYVSVSKAYQWTEGCIRAGKLLTEADSKRLRKK